MKIDSLLPAMAPAEVAAQAQKLENLGIDCAWTFEAAHDAFFPLAFAAAATSRLEIGTNIAVAFARTPFSTAQIAWDLQRYSNGRFRLGLGTQIRQFRACPIKSSNGNGHRGNITLSHIDSQLFCLKVKSQREYPYQH